jgi:hypothetical protein
MALDTLLLIEDVTAAKTSAYTGTAFDASSAGTRPSSPFWVRIQLNDGAASTAATISFDVLHGATSGGTYFLHTSGADQALALSATFSSTGTAIIWIPVATDKRYLKVRMNVDSGTVTTGVKYNAYLCDTKPQ